MKPILLVEDTPDDVLFMQRAFRKAGILHPMQTVADGREALDYLQGKGAFQDRAQFPPPCLILLDLKLPRVSGLDVLRHIRCEQKLTVPVIVLTSSREDCDVQQAYALGANSYKVKPSDAGELSSFVAALKQFWLSHDQSCASSH